MPLPARIRVKRRLKAAVARITRNRLTFSFFLFSFFHCFAQGIVQLFQFKLDAQYGYFFSLINNEAQIDPRAHADLQEHRDHFQLTVCTNIPHNGNDCYPVFDANYDISAIIGSQSSSGSRGILVEDMVLLHNVSLLRNSTNDDGVILRTPTNEISLSEQCIKTLLLPLQRTQNARREDVAFVILQFWLLGIAMMAIKYDYVPHILAGLGTRIILTAWSAYALWRSPHDHRVYSNLIEMSGTPCSVEIFTRYFETRANYEAWSLPTVLLLLLTFYICLSSVLLKVCADEATYQYEGHSAMGQRYNVEFLNRVGASPKIVKINRYFMGVRVCLQLEAFVLLTAAGLWTDQVINTYIHPITHSFKLFVGTAITWMIVLVPWVALGWYGIRYEHRTAMLLFIVVAFVFLTCSSVMFYSDVYRWTYYTWPNFACYVTASLILLIASFILGILCRMNFGQGLSQYLHTEVASSSSGPHKALPTGSSPPHLSEISTAQPLPTSAITEKARSPFADPDDQDTESGSSPSELTDVTTNGVRSSMASTPELRGFGSPFTPVEELISEGSSRSSSPPPSINRSSTSHSALRSPEPISPFHSRSSRMSFPSVARTPTPSSAAPSYSNPFYSRRYTGTGTVISDDSYDTLPSYHTVQRIYTPPHLRGSNNPPLAIRSLPPLPPVAVSESEEILP
ncbi:hypothetical protein V5O48_015306 [Marasmius crinis-equi]|uniref:Uncharacterized protein n=1 Tax=Marasmius crinis-equi TaxID=585013 RepID=A0ABR3EUX6_9AGAR